MDLDYYDNVYENNKLMIDLFANDDEWLTDFFLRLVEETKSGKLKWKQEFNKDLMWDDSYPYYTFKCKIKRRNLFIEFDSVRFFQNNKKDLLYINELYTYIDGEYQTLYEFSSWHYLEEGSEIILSEEKAIYELSRTIEKIMGNPDVMFHRERAISRINLLNKIYDSMMSNDGEFTYFSSGNIESNDLDVFIWEDTICVSKKKSKTAKRFYLKKSDLNYFLDYAFGDIEYNENDYRFIHLIDLYAKHYY